MRAGVLVALILSSPFVIAQGVVGSGYTSPAPVSVAPGQVATFFVAGLSSTTGITATLQQQGGNTSAPVQSVYTISLCPDTVSVKIAACGSLTAVTVQIPYELVPVCLPCVSPVSAAPPILAIAQNGQTLSAIELNPLADEVHVLTQCDIAIGATPVTPNYTGLPCAPLVTHADGSLVSASSPAKQGETVIVWAFGLGQAVLTNATGQRAVSTPTVETFHLDFNYSVNALATKPYLGDPDRVPPTPVYSGVVGGYVGLYQVNLTIPAGPANGIAHCSLPGTVGPGGASVQSNLTVSIGGQYSFDGAGICVDTQVPVD